MSATRVSLRGPELEQPDPGPDQTDPDLLGSHGFIPMTTEAPAKLPPVETWDPDDDGDEPDTERTPLPTEPFLSGDSDNESPTKPMGVASREHRGLAPTLFEFASDGVLITDLEGTIVDVNPAFCAITGYTREEVIGRNPSMMKSDRHDDSFYETMWRTLRDTGTWQGEVWDRRKSGEAFPKWLSIGTVRDENGTATHYVGVFADRSDARRTDEFIERVAHYDVTTGLPNRVLFRDRLRQAVDRARADDCPLAVLVLDIDSFGRVNEAYGHRTGDLVLSAVGRRLANALRDSDTVARLREDEFAIIMPDIDAIGNVAVVARKMLDLLHRPVRVGSQSLSITASVGIAVYPSDATAVETLLQDADAAMSAAKQAGRDTYQFFSKGMSARAARQVTLESGLRRAVARGEFALVYQPRVDVSIGRVLAVEALLRWRDPQKGIVPPSRFIPVAEQSRLIIPIGDWVLRTACAQGRAWIDDGVTPLRVAVNLSAHQFEQRDLARRIAEILADSGFPPELLEIELTESTAMRNPDQTVETLLELKQMGVRIAIDDFGTGYSSLAYLQRFPIDALKIDRSFIRAMLDDPGAATIARAIIGLAHNLRLSVVAEGVETAEQLSFLVASGCDEIQGFLFGRPMLPDRIARVAAGGATFATSRA